MINPCKVYVTADMTDGGMFVFNSGGTEGTVCPSWYDEESIAARKDTREKNGGEPDGVLRRGMDRCPDYAEGYIDRREATEMM